MLDPRQITGTLDMLILEVVSRADSYGYAIVQTVTAQSEGRFAIKEGSLYPALHRLERAGELKSYWVDTDAGRRRKYYRITAKGRRTLKTKREHWSNFAEAVNGVLGHNHVRA